MPPHIAAGGNLNLPLVGPILRRGGAFFLRRSFKANPLYSAVFSEYVATLIGRGDSIEYFIEGGRSRTGRLLTPKAGMLVMTLRAFLRQPRRPVLFQPVYIGYEQLIEGKSYLDEGLSRHAPDWRDQQAAGARPDWINASFDDLAQRIQVNINRAADVNPINLLAVALLSTPKHAMSEADLLAQLDIFKALFL